MFTDRQDAALQLAVKLEKYSGQQTIVLGIPRGGAETAYYIARHLDAALSLIIVRKLGYPYNPECAYGALAEDGTIYYTPESRGKISQEMMDEIEDEQQKEIKRRIKVLRKGRPLPALKDKTIIIADDGIATGATIIAAIRMCKKQGAEKIIVAAPVSSEDKVLELEQEADEVVILQKPALFHAVSEFYEIFHDVTDEQVIAYLERWDEEKGQKLRVTAGL